jgi:hypothetical protein
MLKVQNLQMEEAYRKKKQIYSPILLALQHYIHAGWTIEILSCVVGDLKAVHTKKLWETTATYN